MDLAALLDSAATPSPVPPARTPRVSRLTKKDKQLRRSLLKNKARSKYVVGEARRASKRAEVKAQREDKRMNNLLARRPGLLEAVEEVTASSSSLAPVRTPKKKPTVGQLRRAERLKQYKEEKATRLAEKKNNSRPPFLVGVYKLDGKMPARTKTPLSASSTRTKRQTISSAKPEPSAERKLPTRVRRGLFASKSNSVPHERSLPGPPTKSLSSITLKNQTKVSQKRQVTNRVNKQRHPVSRSDTGPQNGEGEITPHVEVAPVASPEVEVKEGRSLSKAKSNPDPEPEKIPPQSQAKATVRRRSARIAAAANEQEVSNDHKSGGHCLERKVQKNVVANTPRRRSARISVETTHEDEGGPRSKKSRKPVTASSPAAPRKPRRPSCVAVTPLLSVAEEVEDERREEDVKSGRNDGDAVLLSPLSPERVEKLGGSLKPTTSLTPGLNALNIKENRRKDGGRPSVVYAFDPLLPLNFNFADAAARDKEGTPSQAEDPEKHSDDFKTPTLSVRKRRRRPSQFSLLLDPLRHDLEFQRGSHSDQRRKKKGQSPFDAEKSFGFDQIIPDDPSSPVHDQLSILFKSLEKVKSRPSDALIFQRVKSIVAAEAAGEQPPNIFKELEQDFAEAAMEDASSQVPQESSGGQDVAHFRQLLKTETERLNSLCETWEAKVNNKNASIPEEAAGNISSAVGKARLLMNKKGRFHQFSELVDNCEFGRGEKPTTTTDLQGFWDMIYYQVEDIVQGFEQLSALEANSWVDSQSSTQENRPVPAKDKKTTVAGRKRPAPGAGAKASLGLRAIIAAGRKARETTQDSSSDNSVLKPINKEKEKLFEGGFFAIRSPVRKSSPPPSKRKSVGMRGVQLDFDAEQDEN